MEQEARNETDGDKPEEATQDQGASEKPEETAATGSQQIDYAKLPQRALCVLRDPSAALETGYRSGNPALLEGLIFGGAVAILLPLVQLIVVKILMGKAGSVPFDQLVRWWIGGILFLAAGAVVSFFLRPAGESSRPKDFKDDVYLVGSSMLFLLAGVLVGGVFILFKAEFFNILAQASTLSALILAAMTYYFGLQKVTAVEPRRAVWIVPAVFGVAFLVAGLLYFNPIQAMGHFQMNIGAMQQDINRSMQEALRGFGR